VNQSKGRPARLGQGLSGSCVRSKLAQANIGAKEAQPPLLYEELEEAWKIATEGTESVSKLILPLEAASAGLVRYVHAPMAPGIGPGIVRDDPVPIV
jgi:hypothetical protein